VRRVEYPARRVENPPYPNIIVTHMKPTPALLAALAFGCASLPAAEDAAAAFQSRIHPLLNSYCTKCHGTEKQKAKINLDGARNPEQLAAEQETWFRVLEQLQSGEMPPDDEKQPTKAERAAMIAWIRGEYTGMLLAKQSAEGRSKLRRLTRAEYANTIEDIFGIRPLVDRNLPPDGRVDGYDKVATALPLSSEGAMGYFAMAEDVLGWMLKTVPRGKKPAVAAGNPFRADKGGDDLLKAGTPAPPAVNPEASRTTRTPAFQSEQSKGHILELPDGWMVSFNSDTTSGPMKYGSKTPGMHKVRLSVYGYQTDKPLAFGVYVRKSAGLTQELELAKVLEAPPGKPTVIETEIYIEARWGMRLIPFGLGVPVPKNSLASKCTAPGLAFQWMEDVEPETPLPGYRWLTADFSDALKQEMLKPIGGGKAAKSMDRQELKTAMSATFQRVGARLFRRDLTAAEITALTGDMARQTDVGVPVAAAFVGRITAMLTSAHFLSVVEAPGPLSDFALASRLSYFLWNSAPDETLLAIAREGKLRDGMVLAAQTERLLKDPKSRRFVNDFTDQWLGVRGIDDTTPDGKLYPEYAKNELLKHASVFETHAFFGRMLDENLSVRNFVAPTWALVNEPLAKLYGIPGVTGSELQKVNLPASSPHGGLWTQSAVLKVTANGSYTSPVKRGVWVAERLLGTPIPPPPPDTPAVDPDTRGAKTLREQLALHSKEVSCRSCHAIFDPYGFALESFDVTGGFRKNYRALNAEVVALPPQERKGKPLWRDGLPVDCSGKTPAGQPFAGIAELRQMLAKNPEQLARGVTRHLITYATGAPPTRIDEPAIAAIVQNAAPGEYGLRSLVHAVVQSELFRRK